jgi:hypothetical protein
MGETTPSRGVGDTGREMIQQRRTEPAHRGPRALLEPAPPRGAQIRISLPCDASGELALELLAGACRP